MWKNSKIMTLQAGINKSSIKARFRLGRYWFMLGIYKKPIFHTVGLANETTDHKYVPFLDYDNINRERVLIDADALISRYKLSGLCLLTTKQTKLRDGQLYGNYHLMGFDKLKFKEHVDLVNDSCCDDNYKRIMYFYRHRNWVLRVMPKLNEYNWEKVKDKPVFLGWIEGNGYGRICSRAYHNFMVKWYNMPPIKLKFDHSKYINMVKYTTSGG